MATVTMTTGSTLLGEDAELLLPSKTLKPVMVGLVVLGSVVVGAAVVGAVVVILRAEKT